MKRLIFAFVCAAFIHPTMAQEKIIKLFPEGVPGESVKLEEKSDIEGNAVAGESVLRITDVSEPTITLYEPSEE